MDPNNKFSVLMNLEESDDENVFDKNLRNIEEQQKNLMIENNNLPIKYMEKEEEEKEIQQKINEEQPLSSPEPVSEFFEIVDLKIHSSIIGHVIIDKFHKDVADFIQNVINGGSVAYTKRFYTGKPQKVSDLYFKTERCKNGFGNPNSCSYGHRCKFAHTEEELRRHQERSTKIDNYI